MPSSTPAIKVVLKVALRLAPSEVEGLAQGIRPEWPAMSEPGGSPKAERQVSRMVEAAGVGLDKVFANRPEFEN